MAKEEMASSAIAVRNNLSRQSILCLLGRLMVFKAPQDRLRRTFELHLSAEGCEHSKDIGEIGAGGSNDHMEQPMGMSVDFRLYVLAHVLRLLRLVVGFAAVALARLLAGSPVAGSALIFAAKIRLIIQDLGDGQPQNCGVLPEECKRRVSLPAQVEKDSGRRHPRSLGEGMRRHLPVAEDLLQLVHGDVLPHGETHV